MIGRLESFDDDIQYIANIKNLTSALPKNKESFYLHRSGSKRFLKPQDVQKHKDDRRQSCTFLS